MRLTPYEIESIKKAFKESFGEGRVILFGSRVDDSQKGGDIDLYLIPAKQYADEIERKTVFLIPNSR